MGVNVENMRLWVKALRSGRWEQTTSYLERAGKFCCLGVACRVAMDEGGLKMATGLFTDDPDIRWYGTEGNTGVLPEAVVQWLGLGIGDTNVNMLSPTGEEIMASSMNDHYSYTFMEIADAIERTWPEVREQ